MRFLKIPLPAATVTVDPRVAPALVPWDHIITVPRTVPNTDTAPLFCKLTLEGTAANTAVVELWVVDESDVVAPGQTTGDPAALKWYKLQNDPDQGPVVSNLTVTVGILSTRFAAQNGRVYFRVTTGPAAAATLLIAYGNV